MRSILLWLDGSTPEENPVDPAAVTPGIEGFTAIAVLAILVFGLGFFIVRTLRRISYREEVQQEIAEELAARDAAAGADHVARDAAAGADPVGDTDASGDAPENGGAPERG
ncbi:hypothetical protein [Leucobacter sp. OH1287]|uniref:hypothetical protein n=1 Tax=Leucobacter sp. OH1287 TaxID=2491049 RepID=UPI000F5E2162|nr:hypothetical protein [Leucobacter sp. OH1287]RRD60036.1 hypothetical protein EII30_07225 [Leucobacter sp. OH1287]